MVLQVSWNQKKRQERENVRKWNHLQMFLRKHKSAIWTFDFRKPQMTQFYVLHYWHVIFIFYNQENFEDYRHPLKYDDAKQIFHNFMGFSESASSSSDARFVTVEGPIIYLPGWTPMLLPSSRASEQMYLKMWSAIFRNFAMRHPNRSWA